MISLFGRTRTVTPDVLKVPSYCVPCEEAESLKPKRDSQLQWMREKGVRYLGNPDRLQRKTLPPVTISASRVVGIRGDGSIVANALRRA